MGYAVQQPQAAFKLKAVPAAGRTGTEAKSKSPETHKVMMARTQVDPQHSPLPKGLIGARSTAQVDIAGVTCDCLLDTGSQVTTVTQSFYNQNLADQQIRSLNNLLEVESANGQNVPYLGYVEVTITFPKDFVGVSMEVPTLALVIPDFLSAFQPSVLIGTNTLDELYKDFSQQKPHYFSPSYGYKQILKTLEQRQRQCVEGNIGLVRLAEKQSQVIPAGQSTVLCGTASVRGVHSDKWVVVEHPSFSSLPGGLIVKTCVATLGESKLCHLPVVVSNPTTHNIAIPSKCVVAELKAVQSVVSSKPSNSKDESESIPKSAFEFNFGDSPVPSEWKDRLTKRLREMPEVFSMHSQDFGCTDKVKHRINLMDETPFKHRPRPIHPDDMEAVKRHLQELLDAGVIQESVSPYSSPIVVVKKKSGEIRLCIDYRKLNQRTIKDAYALPKLEDTFMALTGSKWFSVLDLKSGFYQIEVEEKDKPKTVFVCPLGFYEFNRMPQGVTNAPSTFQRVMEKCMADINLREVLVFIDDIIVFSQSLEEHEERLLRVLNRLKEYGLKLAPEKCIFAQTSVKYLGHIVSDEGVRTDPDKVAAVKTWPVPKNLKELRSFLGFIGYYRRFVKHFSKKVKPLNDLTSGYPPTRRDIKAVNNGHCRNPKDLFNARWTAACQTAFDQIIEELTTAPVLAFANPKMPYILHTDASTSGLGAALYQEQDGQVRVIAYASRGLSSSESKYPAHKLEFLALKWAVTEKFHDFLYGSTFTAVTDSNPLTYVLSTAKLDAVGYRWLAALSTYNFKLQYRCGKQNVDADGLSRRPHPELPEEDSSHDELGRVLTFVERLTAEAGEQEISSDVIQAICDSRLTQRSEYSRDPPVAFISSLTMQTAAVPDVYSQEDQCGGLPTIPHLSSSDIREAQLADPCIKEVIAQIQTGESPSKPVRDALPRLPYLLKEKDRLEFHDGVLYRRRNIADKDTYQLVLPEKFHADVLKRLHDDLGHMGVDRTLDLVRNRFYWSKMASDIEYKVRTCGRCIRRKVLPEKAAPLVNIITNRPLQLVCMDFLTLEPDRSNVKDVLVITDHFTKYALAIPTPNQKAKTVAKCLWEQFICYYGYPERLHSDQGPDFESHLIKELCEIAGVQKVRTTPYHPRGNPVERFNRTLLNMLGTLETKQKSCWKEFVKPLVHAYNCTRNDTTGFSPYELMFGRQPRLPVDLAFGLPLKDKADVTHSQYVKTLKSNLEESFKIAAKNSKRMADKNKTRYDKRVTASELNKGDRVLVRNVRLRGKHKLADKWEEAVYVIVDRHGDLPVYKVCPEFQTGPNRTLHRDLLLPCGTLSSDVCELESHGSVPRCKTRSRAGCEDPEEETPDSEEEVYYSRFPFDVVNESFTVTTPEVAQPVKKNCIQPLVKGSTCEMPVLRVANGNLPVNPDGNLPVNPDESLPSDSGVQLEREESADLAHSIALEAQNPSHNGEPSMPETSLAEEELNGAENIAIGAGSSEHELHEQNELRRSLRTKEKPKILTYPKLGNPLITIVQSLLQGLNDAFSESLQECADPSYLQRDLHSSKGGGCNPGSKPFVV